MNSDRRGLSNSSSRDATQSFLSFSIRQWRIQRDSSLFTFRPLVSYESDSDIANSGELNLLSVCYHSIFISILVY